MTNCAQHFSYYLRLDLQLLKTPLCKNLGVKKTSGFCWKTPLASSKASATPCFKKLSGALCWCSITASNICLNFSFIQHDQCIHLFADIVRVRYFRDLLSSESERLRKLCKLWDDYNNFTEDLAEEGGYNNNSIDIKRIKMNFFSWLY